jgi:hypothetical protein
VWLLLDLPEPPIPGRQQLQAAAGAAMRRMPGLSALASAAGRLAAGSPAWLAAGALPHDEAARPGGHDPAAAFTRLRYLSLRRCTLSEAAAGRSGGSIRAGGACGGGLFAWWRALVQAVALAREQAAAAAVEDGGRSGDGSGGGSGTAGGGRDHRRRLCSTGGAALLHWLLPRACGGAQCAGSLLRKASGRLAPPFAAGCGATAVPALQALLAACPHLRFVDLTFVSGSGSRHSELARLAAALSRQGNVHYLAVSQPARVPLEAAAAAAAAAGAGGSAAGGGERDVSCGRGRRRGRRRRGERRGGNGDRASGGGSRGGGSRDGGGGGGGSGGWQAWWAWLGWGRRDSSGGGREREEGPSSLRQQAERQAATLGGPLLIESAGMEEIIARELGL